MWVTQTSMALGIGSRDVAARPQALPVVLGSDGVVGALLQRVASAATRRLRRLWFAARSKAAASATASLGLGGSCAAYVYRLRLRLPVHVVTRAEGELVPGSDLGVFDISI